MSTPSAPVIYMMERGFVIVGRKIGDDGPFVILGDCACVRRWGTSKGIGQLAAEGPLRETILDPQPEGTCLRLSHCMEMIPCNPQRWESWQTTSSQQASGVTGKKIKAET